VSVTNTINNKASTYKESRPTVKIDYRRCLLTLEMAFGLNKDNHEYEFPELPLIN